MKGKILMSVYSKRGISEFAKALSGSGYKIIATEGTGKELIKNGISFIPAQEIHKNPDGLIDCIQTISYRIPGGILFDRFNDTHIEDIKTLNIEPIFMVVCNFPPIKEVVKNPEDFNIKNIDVGGPLMIRAAATNFKHVLVIVDPDDYEKVADTVINNKVTTLLKQHLAIKAFIYSRDYDNKIIQYLKHNKM